MYSNSIQETKFLRDIHKMTLSLESIDKTLKVIAASLPTTPVGHYEVPADSRENSDV